MRRLRVFYLICITCVVLSMLFWMISPVFIAFTIVIIVISEFLNFEVSVVVTKYKVGLAEGSEKVSLSKLQSFVDKVLLKDFKEDLKRERKTKKK